MNRNAIMAFAIALVLLVAALLFLPGPNRPSTQVVQTPSTQLQSSQAPTPQSLPTNGLVAPEAKPQMPSAAPGTTGGTAASNPTYAAPTYIPQTSDQPANNNAVNAGTPPASSAQGTDDVPATAEVAPADTTQGTSGQRGGTATTPAPAKDMPVPASEGQ